MRPVKPVGGYDLDETMKTIGSDALARWEKRKNDRPILTTTKYVGIGAGYSTPSPVKKEGYDLAWWEEVSV